MIAGINKENIFNRIKSTVLMSLLLTAAITFFAEAAAGQEQDLATPGVQIHRNIEYVSGGHERQKLDIYLPEDISRNKVLPLIVWVHGGAWTEGSKDWCPLQHLVKKGYAVASINYRLSQHSPFPAQIHDCKAAIRWLRANSKKYKIDPRRVGVCGASAGGHLVALLGTTSGNDELEGTVGGNLQESSRVQAVCDFFGPTDMFAFYEDKDNRHYNFTTTVIDRLLGGPIVEKKELAKSADPVNHVTADDSPFLIMHGDKDDLVPMKQSQLLNEALKKVGVETRLHVLKGTGHGFSGPEINKMIEEFFDRHLRAKGKRTYLNVEYVPGGHERQKLDIYLPEEGTYRGPLPVVVWVHGGAWRTGSKENCRTKVFLEEGYAAASINYRLSQHAIFPAQIEDCKAAIRHLRANAKKYNIDPDRIGVWGSSAGGHLAALLGTTGDIKDFDKGSNLHVSSKVQAVCDFFGPTDFTRMSDFESKMDHDAAGSPESLLVGGPMQENKEACKRANPITYVSRNDPPFLLVHGDKDPLVPHNQSELLYEALKKADMDVKFHTVKGGGHGFRDVQVNRMVREFFNRHLKK